MTTKLPHDDTATILKREAGDIKTVLAWVGAATVVGGGIYAWLGQQRLVEYITAYIVEYSLSVDNLFVFLLLFQFFKVPRDSQEKVLTWGVLGAAVMRLAFIFVGEELEHRFNWVALVFAAILLYSSVKILFTGEDDDEDGEEDLSSNSIVAFSKKLFKFSDSYDGNKFWTVQNGVKLATPLLLTLICIELSDVVFALDSVPAVLGISDNTTVVYMSNIMAIMGLRSLFFVVEDAVANLRFLQPCLGIVLAFIGGKLAGGVFGYDIDTLASLGVVLGVLGGGIGLSYAFPEPKDEKNEIN